MSDDYTKPPPDEEDFTSRPAIEKEGSLNSSMITIIVSLQSMLAVHFFLQTLSSTGRRHPLSSRFSLPPKRIWDIERHHYHVQDWPNPSAKRYRRRVQSLVEVLLRRVSLLMQPWSMSFSGFDLRMYDDYKPSTAEWMNLLSIANTYGLKRVYNRAVAQIEDIDVTVDPVSRVLLAKQFNIKKWLAPAYVALCTRADPIKASEAEKLGIYTFVTIVTARESLYRDKFQSTMKDRTLSVTQKLRCCGHTPSQLHDGDNGAKKCPSCQQIVIPGPGIQPSFINNNRRCCNSYQPYQWNIATDGSRTCPNCDGIVIPAVVTANLRCCGKAPNTFKDGVNGATICPSCHKIVIPGPGEADFINDNRRCCNNPPTKWKSELDGGKVCPSCNGITLPCAPLSDHERALAYVKRVFDLEGWVPSNELVQHEDVPVKRKKKRI